MTTKKSKKPAYNELITDIQNVPAKDLFYFATNFMHEMDSAGDRIAMDETGKIKSYTPSHRTEKLGKVFNVAHNDLPSFMLSAAPANVAELMCAQKRENLLEAMLEIGLEKRIRDFIAKPAPAQDRFEPSL